MASRDPVFDKIFCMPHPMHLIMKPEKGFFAKSIFKVFDHDGNQQLLRVAGADSLLLNHGFAILDNSDTTVATLRSKVFKLTDVWTGFIGGSTKESDILFRVKRQEDKNICNVFMGSDKNKKDRDYDVVGFPPMFYKGDTIIADINENFSWGGDSVKKDDYKIRVHPGIDYTFIISLILIHREMISTSFTNPAVYANNDSGSSGGGDGGQCDGGDGGGSS